MSRCPWALAPPRASVPQPGAPGAQSVDAPPLAPAPAPEPPGAMVPPAPPAAPPLAAGAFCCMVPLLPPEEEPGPDCAKTADVPMTSASAAAPFRRMDFIVRLHCVCSAGKLAYGPVHNVSACRAFHPP